MAETKKKGRPRIHPIVEEKRPRGRPRTAIERVKREKPGRPRKIKIKRPVGRPSNNREKSATVTLLLGTDYIALLNTISDQERRNKSAIMRDIINRLAVRTKLPTAEYDYGELPYRPSMDSSIPKATFTVGQAHVDLLKEVFDKMDNTLWETREGGEVKFGKSQMVREEIDRYAVENGFTPIKKVSDKVLDQYPIVHKQIV